MNKLTQHQIQHLRTISPFDGRTYPLDTPSSNITLVSSLLHHKLITVRHEDGKTLHVRTTTLGESAIAAADQLLADVATRSQRHALKILARTDDRTGGGVILEDGWLRKARDLESRGLLTLTDTSGAYSVSLTKAGYLVIGEPKPAPAPAAVPRSRSRVTHSRWRR